MALTLSTSPEAHARSGILAVRYGNLRTMPSDDPDARVLLDVAPDQYVTERTRLIKQARADGNRPLANFYQSLKRPSVAVWAVLAAVPDAGAVDGVVAVTTKLGETQAAGSDPAALKAATKDRRKVVEAIVDRSVKALARFDAGAEKRRAEIRGVVDQLSRHPELVGAWVDATLRDLPDDDFGFGAFADLQVTTPAKKPAPAKAARPKRSVQPETDVVRDLGAERAGRAERVREARNDVSAAAKEVTAAQRRVQSARTALRDAEKEARLSEEALAGAERRHAKATSQLEAAQARSTS
jgi:hypothetical protein